MLPALLAIGLLTLGCASTASATVLCKTASNPCTGGTYGEGTSIEAVLKAGTKSVLATGLINMECEEAVIKGEVTNPGGEPGTPVSGIVTELKFGACNCQMTALKNGSFYFSYTGEGNGTLTLEGFEIKNSCLNCRFDGPSALALTGGEMASASANTTMTRTPSIWCEPFPTWTASFTVTAPEPLYVAES